MAEKFNEHVLKVKAGLDKASQQEMRDAMRSIFVDEAHIDFNNPENIKGLRELAAVMKKIFAQAGNTKFDFTNMIKLPGPEMFDELKKAALEFDQVWSSIVSKMGNIGGVSDGLVHGITNATKQAEVEFDELIKMREKKMREMEKLEEEHRIKLEEARKFEDYNPYGRERAPLDDQFVERAKKAVKEFIPVHNALVEARRNGKVTATLLKQWVSSAEELKPIYATISEIGETRAEALLGKTAKLFAEEKYDSITGFGSDAIDMFISKDQSPKLIQNIKKEVAELDVQINKLTTEHPELIDKTSAKEAEERLNKVNEAYNRLFVSRGTKKGELSSKKLNDIVKALDYQGKGSRIPELPENYTTSQLDKYNVAQGAAKKSLEESFRLYDTSVGKSWEERAKYLLKAVAEFESWENNPYADKDVIEPYRDTYKELKSQAELQKQMLRDVISLQNSKPMGVGTEDVVGAQKISSATEAQVESQHEIADAAERRQIATENTVKAEEKERKLLLENKKLLERLSSSSGESGTFYNSKTGEYQEVKDGAAHSITTTSDEWENAASQFDTRIHKHNFDVAAPSLTGEDNDFATWVKGFKYIKKQMIKANTEILSFDFSSLSEEALKGLADAYTKAATEINNEFDAYIKNGQVDKKFGTIDNLNEELQVRLRAALDSIVADPKYSGVMTPYKIPDAVPRTPDVLRDTKSGLSLSDEYVKANEEVKKLIKQLAVLYSTYDDDFVGDAEEDPIMALEERLRNLRPDIAKIEAAQFEDLAKTLTPEEQSTIVEEIKSEAAATEQAVDGLNESLEKTQQLTSGDGTGGGKGGASSSELEAERAKAESLQNEIEQKNSALNAANEEKQALQNDLDATRQQLEDSEHEKSLYDSAMNQIEEESNAKDRVIYDLREQLANDGDALFAAEQRANEAEERASNLERKLAGSFDGEKKQGSVNTEELKTLLNSIVYNVKIVHDDNDKTANKIALDDSTLEATLTKVFANILNPQTQQNDSEQKQSSWALESTLQTVKGVLDNIHTNTTKIGGVNTSNVDEIAGTALDGRLIEIKSVLESIDNKIAKGGIIATRGAVKQANAQPVESEAKAQAARSNMMKSIINDYKTLGKLSAKFASDGNLETKAMLENLKEEIARKRQSLKLTMDENASLREKYSIAFDAEKRLLDAEKAQKEINAQNKADAKEAEIAWKKQIKDAQRSTGINAATSAANAGDQTVLRAIGTEGISKDIENKAKDLSNQIKTLRILRDEIDRKGEQASAEDRDNLSKQISKVKELKTEVDGYLKIHEKYSGDNVTDLGDASNFGAVGTDQYWKNITAAIKNASSGKTTIKGLNADTGELTGTTKIAANTFATWSATVDPLTGRLSMLRTGIKKTETIIEQITRKTKEIFTYFSGSSIIFKVFNELKKGIQYVRDIDLALTELKKVTDETEETYDEFLKTASKTAAKVGSTIKDVVSSTADWARLGYSMKEAAEFAESTQILMNVSEFTDVSQATDTLISAVQAFGYTAETSMDVVDLLNTIGKQNCRNYIVIYG